MKMSRGRKTKSVSDEMNWQQIFNKNVGVYLQDIIIELGRSKQIGPDTSLELVTKIKAEKAIFNSKETTLLPINSKEIPFEIPSNWQWCRLGELFYIERGSSPRPKGDHRYFSKIKTRYNWITISDMTAFAKDTPLSDTREYLTELGTKHSRYVTPKDIIVVASGSAGRSSLLGIDGYIYDGLMAVKNIQDDVMRNFLFYMFKVFQTSMMDVASGATWQNINTDILKNQLIPIPPLSEQSLILSFLNDFKFNRLKVSGFYFNKAVEQKIIKLHKSQLLVYENFSLISDQLTQLTNLNQAILQEAVQGKLMPQNPTDEPASELLKRIKSDKLKAGKKEKPLPPFKAAEIPFEIPESWVWCRMGDVSTSIVPNRDKPKSFTGNVPWITQSNFSDFSFKLDYDLNGIGLSMEEVKEYNCRVMPQGSVIMSCVGQFDLVCLIERDIVANQQLHCFVPFGRIEPMYLCYSLKLFSKLMEKEAIHTTIKYINKTKCESIILPLPPLSEQIRIVAEVEKQLAKTKQIKEHVIANQHATEQLLKALLHGAFEVKEMEEV